jgi:pimeloyl-ACP methyl ester carboxylesterase
MSGTPEEQNNLLGKKSLGQSDPALLPVFEAGCATSDNVIFFMAGFPDHETSAWGHLLEVLLEAEKAETAEWRLICMCLPDFQANPTSAPRRWGWEVGEILKMLESTIDKYVVPSKQFKMIVHDWGAVFGFAYEYAHPGRISKLVALDVGHGISGSCGLLITLLYQWWWAIAYILSQVISISCGDCFFRSYKYLTLSCCKPTPQDMDTVPRKDYSVHMCYIYYQFWKEVIVHKSRNLAKKFPLCPLLFLVMYYFYFYYFLFSL